MRTTDFESAKLALDRWFVESVKPVLDDNLELSRCLLEYYEQHAKFLARADTERHNLSLWLEFFNEKLVREVRPSEQRRFLSHLAGLGYAKSTIEGIFKSGTAALNFAWKNDMLLSNVPILSPGKELKKFSFEKRARWRALHINEVVRLIDAAGTDRLIRFIMILIATGARPAAALEIEGQQINLKANTLSLLRPGTEQNNKYRPTVRLPSFIRAIYHQHNICSQRKVHLNPAKPMDSIKTSWNTARRKSGLDDLVVPYSIRHTMAKWLRTVGVDSWHTSGQLGHRQAGAEITEIYASFDPAYLAAALDAIEGYFAIVYSKSEKLQSAPWLKKYTPRCGLVAEFEKFT